MKNRTRKLVGLVAALGVVGSGLTLANPASAATNLTIWADKGTLDTIKSRVQKWDTDNAAYTVTIVERDFGTVREVLKTAVPKGQGPDILAGAAHDWIGNLVAANVLLPIDANLPANFKDDFVPGALQAMKFNGKYYGVPGWTENIAILRNIKKAPKPAKSVNDIKDGELGINYDATNSDPYHMYPFQSMFKAPVFKTYTSGANQGDWTDQVGMGGANGAAFAKWLAQKGTKFFGPPSNAKILCDFLNPTKTTTVKGKKVTTGAIKYWVTGAWNINAIESGAGGCKTGLKVGTGYAIDPLPTGAVELMRFMSSESTQFSLYDNFNKTPANKAALNSAKSNPVIKGFADAANTVPMPNSPAMAAAWTIWGKAQTRIIQGKEKKPDVAWAAMVKALQSTIDKTK